MDHFVCEICGNDNPKYIGYRKGKPYCRKCISFRGEEAKNQETYPKYSAYKLSYELSEEQEELSQRLLNNYKEAKNTLVYAVCGAGKTELVLKVIQYAIKCGERVGFAIPRRDVVIEICNRFASIFTQNKVISVYGDHTNTLEGDLVILTTHQLFRYSRYFDLLIIDEIDAFPFYGNEVLNSFFYRSIKGHYIMMSATPSDEILKQFTNPGNEIVELFTRYHRHPLPVPEIVEAKSIIIYFRLLHYLKLFLTQNKPTFIFAPTIEMCEETYLFVSSFCKGGNFVHSKKEDRAKVIDDFRNNKYKYLVTTAVLERGVTVRNLQVIVYRADNQIYNRHSLVQIAGRAGRKIDAPDGRVIFLVNEKNEEIVNAVEQIKRANKNLQNLFPTNT